MGTNDFKKYGYQITTNPEFQNKRFGITPEVAKILESAGLECMNNSSPKLIEKLTKLIELYPSVPQFKNYLTIVYQKIGKPEKALEANKWILTEHPDYLFARLNEANRCIENNEFDKVSDLMHPEMEIRQLYPERDLFHIAEVTGYYSTAIRYFVAIENIDLAANRLKVLMDIAPDHPDTQKAESFLYPLIIKKTAERLDEETKDNLSPIIVKHPPNMSYSDAPHFNHPEINQLYEFGIDIPQETLNEILALPRNSLIDDLEKVLDDAAKRYTYFSKKNYDEKEFSFAIHAIFLLMELNAKDSLPKILSLLEYDVDFLELLIDDHITETIWQCIYKLGFTQTNLLKQYLLKPGIDSYSKNAVSQALTQMVFHHPEKRQEIMAIYSEVLTVFANAKEDDNLINSEFLGLAVADTAECGLLELLPLIKELYDKNLVSLGISGNYDEFLRLNSEMDPGYYKYQPYNIFELYNEILTTWAGYAGDEDDFDDEFDDNEEDILDKQFSQRKDIMKIGRNDPCPCGSGKKFKNCCIDKLN